MDKVRVGHWVDGQNDEAQPGQSTGTGVFCSGLGSPAGGGKQYSRSGLAPPGAVFRIPSRAARDVAMGSGSS